MESRNRIAIVLVLLIVAVLLSCVLAAPVRLGDAPPTVFAPSETPTPRFAEADVWVVAVIVTYEARVFPEPYKSQAYTAIAWTMRNRIERGFNGAVSYTDDRLLSRYASYDDHKNDLPDSRALEIARQVLSAVANDDDPTHGARHYVDNSYWTGTHDQIGSAVKVRGKFSDADLQRLIDDNQFVLTIEWRSPVDHPRGQLFYGLYFFDYWPPPTPVVTPTFTPTLKPTATITRTSTRTPTLTATPRITVTPSITSTLAITATPTITVTPILSPTATLTPDKP